ncbi:MAG TPA: hypothetical protein VEA63_16185, partial [Opitutus sp.]|nr:hypothetical protein [Opitutus sp.]
VGRGPTPSAGALTSPRIETWGLVLQQLAVAPLLVGAWLMDERWLSAGVWLLAAGVVLFSADMLGVLKHLWIAGAAAPKTEKKS